MKIPTTGPHPVPLRRRDVHAEHWRKAQAFLRAWSDQAWACINCLNTLKRMHPEVAAPCDASNRKVSVLESAITIAMFELDDLRLGQQCDRRHDGIGGKLAHGVESN